MKFGVALASVGPGQWVEVARAADCLGFDSVWLPEHLVLPLAMSGSPYPGSDHPPLPPDTPLYDAVAVLSFLAGATERVRLGSYVSLLAIRHPFVAARGWATLDRMSGGRAVVGVGAGWLAEEWTAAGLDPATRGERLDEAIGVCRRLWTQPVVEHHGTHFSFDPVAFEPKPLQQPLPLHVGGESPAALRRAARLGDGWLGMQHTPTTAAATVARLGRELERAGRDRGALEITVSGACDSPADVAAWEQAGVDRLLVRPWSHRSQAVDAMQRFADTVAGTPG